MCETPSLYSDFREKLVRKRTSCSKDLQKCYTFVVFGGKVSKSQSSNVCVDKHWAKICGEHGFRCPKDSPFQLLSATTLLLYCWNQGYNGNIESKTYGAGKNCLCEKMIQQSFFRWCRFLLQIFLIFREFKANLTVTWLKCVVFSGYPLSCGKMGKWGKQACSEKMAVLILKDSKNIWVIKSQ